MTPGTVDADLEPACHLALHGLPVAPASEPLRRGRGDLRQHSAHGRSYLHRARIEEITPGHCLGGVVVTMPPEERNIMRVIW